MLDGKDSLHSPHDLQSRKEIKCDGLLFSNITLVSRSAAGS